MARRNQGLGYDPPFNNESRVREKPLSVQFFSPGGPSHSLDDMGTAGIYVWERQKLFPDDGKTGAQSRNIHINVDPVGSNLTVSAAAVPRNVHPAISESLVSFRIGEGSTNGTEPTGVSGNTLSEKIGEVRPVKDDSAALLISAL